MSEHEKLKEICEKIGYNLSGGGRFFISKDGYGKPNIVQGAGLQIDVREIIFTKKFLDKLSICKGGRLNMDSLCSILCRHSDNPVEYLYNLIN